MDKSDEEFLRQMNQRIQNSKTTPEIMAEMAQYGYTPERFDEGVAFANESIRLNALQQMEYGDKMKATDEATNLFAQVKKEYKRHLGIARIALPKDASAFTALQMGGSREKTTSACLAQIASFYTNLLGNPAWMDAVGGFGIKRQELEKSQALHHQVELAYSAQLKGMGEAHGATKMRDEALRSAHLWDSQFVKVARIALDGQPRLLEILGIRPR